MSHLKIAQRSAQNVGQICSLQTMVVTARQAFQIIVCVNGNAITVVQDKGYRSRVKPLLFHLNI